MFAPFLATLAQKNHLNRWGPLFSVKCGHVCAHLLLEKMRGDKPTRCGDGPNPFAAACRQTPASLRPSPGSSLLTGAGRGWRSRAPGLTHQEQVLLQSRELTFMERRGPVQGHTASLNPPGEILALLCVPLPTPYLLALTLAPFSYGEII